MSLPKYNDFYDIILNYLADGMPHSCADVRRHIAKETQISEEDLRLLLPHGNGKSVFMGRVGWAGTYLHKAGLIDYPKRGVYQITAEGRKVLGENLPKIDNNILSRYPSFLAFQRRSTGGNEIAATAAQNTVPTETSNATPEDKIESAMAEINATLEDELLTAILEQDFSFFENLVVRLMQQMGYGCELEGACRVTGKSGDEGIDGIIREDKLGFSSIYLQAKRWKRNASVSRPEVQSFVGALQGQKAKKGVFITTTHFCQTAYDYVEKLTDCRVVLIDGTKLAQLMIEHNLGVSVESTYHIKRLDTDFFPDTPDEG